LTIKKNNKEDMEAEQSLARGVDCLLDLDMARAEAEASPLCATHCSHALLFAAVRLPPPPPLPPQHGDGDDGDGCDDGDGPPQAATIRTLLTESEEDSKEAFKRIEAAQKLLDAEPDKTVLCCAVLQ
jgi:hypothetical protein